MAVGVVAGVGLGVVVVVVAVVPPMFPPGGLGGLSLADIFTFLFLK